MYNLWNFKVRDWFLPAEWRLRWELVCVPNVGEPHGFEQSPNCSHLCPTSQVARRGHRQSQRHRQVRYKQRTKEWILKSRSRWCSSFHPLWWGGGKSGDILTRKVTWYLGTEELVNLKTKISSYCLLFSFLSVSNSSWEWSPAFCLHWLTPLYTALSGATQCDGGITTSSGPWWILLHLLWHATPLASPSTANSSSSWLLWCNTHPGIPPTPPTPFAYPCPSPGSWGPKSSGFCFGHHPLSTLPQRSELFCGTLSSCTWQFPTTSLVKIKAIFPITAPCFHLSPQHFISNMEPTTFPTKTSWLCPDFWLWLPPDFWLWLPRGGGKRGDGSDGNRQDQEHTLCIKGQPLSLANYRHAVMRVWCSQICFSKNGRYPEF